MRRFQNIDALRIAIGDIVEDSKFLGEIESVIDFEFVDILHQIVDEIWHLQHDEEDHEELIGEVVVIDVIVIALEDVL